VSLEVKKMCNRKGLVSCVTPVYNGESHL